MEDFKHLIRNNKLKFAITFFAVFGSIWLIIESGSSLSDWVKSIVDPKKEYILCFSTLISLIVAFVHNFPKRKIEKTFKASNTSISVRVGNLFDEKENIAIGSSDYFDTNYGVNSNISLKSQMINSIFGKNTKMVDRLISESLNSQNLNFNIDEQKPFGKKEKYKIGDVAILPDKGRSFFIVVLSKLQFDNANAKHTVSDIQIINSALFKLWDKLKTEGRLKEISVPVFGSGLSAVNISHLLLIQNIILSFVNYSKVNRFTDRLNIIIYEKNYDPKEFDDIAYFIQSIEI